ncbi:hypothetical protein V8F20_008142 [Naviculisporaceae sp. PSN 640]
MFPSGFKFEFTGRSGRPQTASNTRPARIISPVATPCYWLHVCLHDKKVYTPLDVNIEATPSSGCGECGYVPRYDTILVNESHQCVETLSGKNLLPHRFTPYLLRCGHCMETSKNYLAGHPELNRALNNGLWHGAEKCNNCWHPHAIKPYYNMGSREDCRDCVVVNPYNEEFAMLVSTQVFSHDGVTVAGTSNVLRGGPWERHQNAVRMEVRIQLAQQQKEQKEQQQEELHASAATRGRKRSTDSAGLEQGTREPGWLPNPPHLPHHPAPPRT